LSENIDQAVFDSINMAFCYKPREINLFISALTHKSTSNDNYERLEILGDSVLQLVITEMLYEKYPSYSEGEITVARQNLVNTRNLKEYFRKLNLRAIFSKINPDFKEGNIFSDIFESLIGALYIDSGYENTRTILCNLFSSNITEQLIEKDPKTSLQEYMQSKKLDLPIYSTKYLKNEKTKYIITCELKDLKIKKSIESNKVKPAEQQLANIILKKLYENN
jgi:ribonuclease-3